MTTVLVVDDSRFMRTVLSKSLEKYGYNVETAENGEDAVEKVSEIDPDVVTMDVEMPVMDGIEAVEEIMKKHPVPILMLSALTGDGAETTLEAINKGAVDFVRKPNSDGGTMKPSEVDGDLVEKIEAVAQSDISSYPKEEQSSRQIESPITPDTRTSDIPPPTIVIGASTGGPSVIEDILVNIPIELNARILVIQHMPKEFTPRFANRLNKETEYTIFEAQDGDTLKPGCVAIAKGDEHMRVNEDNDGEITLSTSSEPTNIVTPSISETLNSIPGKINDPIVTVLLTGMGSDGVDALDDISNLNGKIIAQNQETSPVFGIPRRAISTGYVDEILADNELVTGIINRVKELQDK